MESTIKIRATVPEMNAFFEEDGGVRYMEIRDKRYSQSELNAMPEEQYNSTKFIFLCSLPPQRAGKVPARDVYHCRTQEENPCRKRNLR